MSERDETVSLAFAGGGTGGHLVPGVHLVRWLERETSKPIELVWFNSGRKIEDRVLGSFRSEQTTLRRVALALEPKGGGAPSLLRTTMRAAPETLRVRRELVTSGASVVVGLGGFTSLAPILAARTRNLPIVMLEINAVAGRATRTLGRFADHVVHAWPASVPEGAVAPRHEVLGPPLDPSYAEPVTAEAKLAFLRSFELDVERPLLVVLGGSQGAGALNAFLREHARALVEAGLSVVHQVGPGRLSEGADADLANYVRVEYLERVGDALGAATCVLARGGASTLAEIAARRVPAVVVPYPHHADRHQFENARALGAGVELVEEQNLGEQAVARLLGLIGPEGEATRVRMSRALESALDPEAGRRLARLVLKAARA